MMETAQIHKECIQVSQIGFEQGFYVLSNLIEVKQNITLVFFFSEFLYDIALSYTAGTIDENSTFSVLFFFPFLELIIYFSSHNLHLS